MKEILDIPFVSYLGIEEEQKDTLKLSSKPKLANHLGSIHAGVIYTLAETQSGLFLSKRYCELNKNVIPLLRSSNIRYKKQIKNFMIAKAWVEDELSERFEKQFSKKGRGSIEVMVEVLNEENEVCAVCEFVWFVQEVKL